MPILFLQNITGFMVGSDAERNGIAKNSAKLVYAVSNARVPRYTVVTGGSYGAGNYGMSGRGFRPRFMFMWPNARLGTMSPDVGSSVLMDLRRSSISRNPADRGRPRRARAKAAQMFDEQSNPYYCTARLWDDGLIDPADTREVLALCLAVGAMEPPIDRSHDPSIGCKAQHRAVSGFASSHPLGADRQSRRDRAARHAHLRPARDPDHRGLFRCRRGRRSRRGSPMKRSGSGLPPARASYLDINAIIAAAKQTDADADPSRIRLPVRECRASCGNAMLPG